jgi:hypothetical protein
VLLLRPPAKTVNEYLQIVSARAISASMVAAVNSGVNSVVLAKRVRGRPFVKGVVTNPKGRPPIKRDCHRLIKDACPDAIRALTDLLNSDKASYRIQAAATLLAYGVAKPTQSIDINAQAPPVVNVVFLDQVNGNSTTRPALVPDNGQ